MSSAIGILGGTFNPIHYAHLRLAEELADALDLQAVRLIPTNVPPHRGMPSVNAHHRLEMVRLACQSNGRLIVDDRECRRPGPSYTVDTLREIRDEVGLKQPLCLLMGMDAFAALMTWSRWRQLFELAHIAIARRPGFELDPQALPDELASELETRLAAPVSDISMRPAGSVTLCTITALDISGTAIRSGVAHGRSPRYLLPDSVLDYIRQHQLYKDVDAG